MANHLNETFHSIYFISGVEDLLIIESLDAIRKAANKNDYTDKTSFTVSGKFNWSEIDNAFKFPQEKKHELALPPQSLWERLDP